MKRELEKIDEQLKEDELNDEFDGNFDKALYKIPNTDEEYTKILQVRFGHPFFRAG